MKSFKSKEILRREVSKRVRALTSDDRRFRSEKIVETLTSHPAWDNAALVCLSLSMEMEVDLRDILFAENSGKALCVLKASGDTFIPVTWDPRAKLHKNQWGVMEPKDADPVDPKAIDLVIVPGLAFGLQGQRLGRGMGFYDAFLREIRALRIGLAFDVQIESEIPMEHWDQKMDIVITEKRVIHSA